MLDCTDDPERLTTETLTDCLENGMLIKTPIQARPEIAVSAAGTIILRPGDERCTECNATLGPFGAAPPVLVLARMRRKHGATYCAGCHQTGETQEATA